MNEEGRQLEAKARKELEDAGCPSCYSPEFDIILRNDLQNIPQKYRAIVEYWLSLLWFDNVILCAQASDWRKFRGDQLSRCRYRSKCFDDFVGEIRERRRRHGLSGDVHLQPDSSQQHQLENWIEFADYHLKQLEWFEAKRDESKRKLDAARKLCSDKNALEQKGAKELSRNFRGHVSSRWAGFGTSQGSTTLDRATTSGDGCEESNISSSRWS